MNRTSRLESDRRTRSKSSASRSATPDTDTESHPNIVHLFETFHLGPHYVLVFEPLGPSLYDLQRESGYAPFPLEDIRLIASECLHGLAFLHSLGVTHTDIKMENVLFSCDARPALMGGRGGYTGEEQSS